MRIRTPLVLILAVALALPLAACGRKGPPEAPEGSDPRYPRSYPAGATPQPQPQQQPQQPQ